MRRRPRRDRRGFALIAALWLLVAISAVGLNFSLEARDGRLYAMNALDGSRARYAAAGGIERAHALLDGQLRRTRSLGATSGLRATAGSADGADTDPWRDAARLFTDTTRLGDARYAFRVRDAGATLNVNLATETDLRRLMVALRIDAGLADRIAQAVADWRDGDDLRHARGAEARDYVEAGAPTLPDNAPFRSIAELRDVLGMTAETFDRVAPHLTVMGSGQINLASADRAVLLTLPGIGDEAAAAIMRARRASGPMPSLDEIQKTLSSGARAMLLGELPQLSSRTVTTTRELEVESDGWSEGSRVRARVRALFVRAGDASMVVGRRAD
jgi:general secretion pathway protein K